MARVFGQGLAAPVGSVLPLRRVGDDGARRWQSGKWFFRADTLFLIPGDSPIGFRLPLDSLPWADPDSIESEFERGSVRAAASRCRRRRAAHAPRAAPGGGAFDAGAAGRRRRPAAAEPGVVRTALAVEPRGGMLHVFFPPLYAAEDWLDLIAADRGDRRASSAARWCWKATCRRRDPRLLHFSVTPDPGVIEVNVHPADNWAEHVERTEQLYEEARAGRAGHGEIHARRPPCRHRRRQPCGDGRRARRRTARSCAGPTC